jgi:molecular chaperone DnaK (HSP70)
MQRMQGKSQDTIDLKQYSAAHAHFLASCERAKIELSTAPTAAVEVLQAACALRVTCFLFVRSWICLTCWIRCEWS